MNTFLVPIAYDLYLKEYKVKSCYRKSDFKLPKLQ